MASVELFDRYRSNNLNGERVRLQPPGTRSSDFGMKRRRESTLPLAPRFFVLASLRLSHFQLGFCKVHSLREAIWPHQLGAKAWNGVATRFLRENFRKSARVRPSPLRIVCPQKCRREATSPTKSRFACHPI